MSKNKHSNFGRYRLIDLDSRMYIKNISKNVIGLSVTPTTKREEAMIVDDVKLDEISKYYSNISIEIAK